MMRCLYNLFICENCSHLFLGKAPVLLRFFVAYPPRHHPICTNLLSSHPDEMTFTIGTEKTRGWGGMALSIPCGLIKFPWLRLFLLCTSTTNTTTTSPLVCALRFGVDVWNATLFWSSLRLCSLDTFFHGGLGRTWLISQSLRNRISNLWSIRPSVHSVQLFRRRCMKRPTYPRGTKTTKRTHVPSWDKKELQTIWKVRSSL